MSRLSYNLGYGKYADVELDTFTRILTSQIYDTEEIRKDWDYPFEYVAIADIGSDTSLPVWNCIRCTWDNGHKIRVQFKSNISWDNRINGWS